MTNHEIAREVARIIRETIHHDDGSLKPCVGGVLNPQWVRARSNNAAVVIADLFQQEAQELVKLIDSRGTVVAGEVGALPTKAWDEPPFK